MAIPWHNWGHLYPKVNEKHTGEFSSYTWSMQFFAFQAAGRGLSIAAHDPDQHYKSYVVDPGNETTIVTRVPDGTKPGVGLADLYPTIVDLHDGGWFQSCKRYREWAIQQKWCAKGPISKRKDTPQTLTDIGIWFVSSLPEKGSPTTPDMWADEIIKAASYHDVPVAVQIYHWHEIPFDNDYPEYFPAKPGVAEAIRKLVAAGIVAAPYINARLWDYRAKTFPEAFPSTAKDPTGTTYLEIYGPESGLLMPMCTQTRLWQDRVFNLCKRIYEELGANAVYLDQVAAMPAAPCYDESHGHPLGGGHHWHDGYRVVLDRVKDYIAGTGRQLFLTTENPGDAHIDGCDAFLIWNPRQETEVPMMTAVYSGYSLYFASKPHCVRGDAVVRHGSGARFRLGLATGVDGPGAAGAAQRLSAEACALPRADPQVPDLRRACRRTEKRRPRRRRRQLGADDRGTRGRRSQGQRELAGLGQAEDGDHARCRLRHMEGRGRQPGALHRERVRREANVPVRVRSGGAWADSGQALVHGDQRGGCWREGGH